MDRPRKLTAPELRQLAASPQFQELLAADPELNRLESLKYDDAADFLLLAEVLHLMLAIGSLPVQPLTPAIWALLWALKSPYARDEDCSSADVDLFVYLLSHGIRNLGCEFAELPGRASGCHRLTGLGLDEVHAQLRDMIRIAFRPLELLPRTGAASAAPRYDADWMTRIVSIAAQEANERASYVMYEMSLSAACCYYVQRRRREDSDAHLIRRTAPGELARMMMDRTNVLAIKYLENNNADGKNHA